MDTLYELGDWPFDNALWVFIGMVAVVMTVGPWLLNKQCKKNLPAKGLRGKYFIVSFFVGLISILLFYGLGFLFGKYINSRYEEVLFFIDYFIILHIITVMLSKLCFGKLPTITTGWHLTVMCSLCTGLFFIMMFFGILQRSVEFDKGKQVEHVGDILREYVDDRKTYPECIADIFPPKGQREDNISIYTEKSGRVRVEDVTSNPLFKDLIHFLPLPENAPKDLLWVWVNPDQYYSTKMPVVLFDGGFRTIKKTALPELIERSQKWLAEHQQPDKTPSAQKAK